MGHLVGDAEVPSLALPQAQDCETHHRPSSLLPAEGESSDSPQSGHDSENDRPRALYAGLAEHADRDEDGHRHHQPEEQQGQDPAQCVRPRRAAPLADVLAPAAPEAEKRPAAPGAPPVRPDHHPYAAPEPGEEDRGQTPGIGWGQPRPRNDQDGRHRNGGRRDPARPLADRPGRGLGSIAFAHTRVPPPGRRSTRLPAMRLRRSVSTAASHSLSSISRA